MHPYPELLPGDIAGVKRKDFIGRMANKMLVPHTDLFHFFLIGDYLSWDDDYVILESISKGIAVGRLSFYNPADVVIFRRVLPEDWHRYYEEGGLQMQESPEFIRKKAAAALTLKGRARYDWLLILQLALTLPGLLLRGKFPPYQPEDLPYGRNKAYICTEAVVFAWQHVGFPIVPKHIVPVPAAIVRAVQERRLVRIYPPRVRCISHMIG